MPDFLTVCESAARAGAAVLLELRHGFRVREKGPRDLVTEADTASQAAIRSVLWEAFPDHGFLGEETLPDDGARESGQREGTTAQYRWVVDPLDGTVNYVHQLPGYAVSVALERNGEPVVGVVLDPIIDECFTARASGGAQLNGEPIHAGKCTELDQALVAASFSSNVPRGSPEIARFIEALHACQSLRRMGSAALNLCYVASGRLDAYFATSLKRWDAAAGALIVREAGGVLTDLAGGPFDLGHPSLMAAGTPRLHEALLEVLR
jgi:myo-inositol-1(or 4)-monophosphatase